MDIEQVKRVVTGKAGEEERREVEAWAEGSVERRRFLADARAYYGGVGVDREGMERRLREVWWQLSRRWPGGRRIRLTWWGAAACVALVAGVVFYPREEVELRPLASVPKGVQIVLPDGSRHAVDRETMEKTEVPGFWMNERGELRQLAVAGEGEMEVDSAGTEVWETRWNEVVVPRGTTYTLVLADGTGVHLNAETQVRFPERFDGLRREVELEGEAFFEVVRDERRPFVVRAGEAMVRVLGTSFDVRAYAGDDVMTTLVEGSVRFASELDSVVLHPGELCEMKAGEGTLTRRRADLMSVLAWRSNEFVFRDVPLETVMEEVARWYDVEVAYGSDAVRERKVYVYVNRPQTVREMLDYIVQLGGVEYELIGNKVILTEKKERGALARPSL